MKKVYSDKILNIEGSDIFDSKYLFEVLIPEYNTSNVEVFFMKDLLLKRENTELLNNIGDKYAMFENVYSQKDELEIFKELFDYAINNNKKIHIVGVTLDEEIKILEEYYQKLGFLREDINCFKVDFSVPLVTVSVNIENLMWRGSDYKRMKKEIFFVPPIREAGCTKAMFKGITRGVTAGINFGDLTKSNIDFLTNCLLQEHVLPLNLAKVLSYNLKQVGFEGVLKNIEVKY